MLTLAVNQLNYWNGPQAINKVKRRGIISKRRMINEGEDQVNNQSCDNSYCKTKDPAKVDHSIVAKSKEFLYCFDSFLV